jgi:hypothetical protein
MQKQLISLCKAYDIKGKREKLETGKKATPIDREITSILNGSNNQTEANRRLNEYADKLEVSWQKNYRQLLTDLYNRYKAGRKSPKDFIIEKLQQGYGLAEVYAMFKDPPWNWSDESKIDAVVISFSEGHRVAKV